MSWDVIVLDLPREARAPEEIPDEWQPQPLMPRQALIDEIRRVAGVVRWLDPGETILEVPGLLMDISIGDEDPIETFTFEIRGGDACVEIVVALLEHFGLRALDTGTGGFFDPRNATDGLHAWREFRDRAIGSRRPWARPPHDS